MPYREHLPHPALRPWIDRFWVSTRGPRAETRRILPDGCIDLLIDLSDAPRPIVVGTMTHAVVVPADHLSTVVAVRFKPGGAVPFLRVRAADLTDLDTPLGDLSLRWLDVRPLERHGDPDAAVMALQTLLLKRLGEVETPDPIVAHGVKRLFGETPPTIDALSDETGYSRQHLTRLFQQRVGVSPKHFARVARLQRVLAELHTAAPPRLADLALTHGYFDQAHMNRDFRDLAGVTPESARGSIFPIRSLLDAASWAS